jgi:hypothetical protein
MSSNRRNVGTEHNEERDRRNIDSRAAHLENPAWANVNYAQRVSGETAEAIAYTLNLLKERVLMCQAV